jgi:hypothetical protein
MVDTVGGTMARLGRRHRAAGHHEIGMEFARPVTEASDAVAAPAGADQRCDGIGILAHQPLGDQRREREAGA